MRIAVITPVFNDWVCLWRLVRDIDAVDATANVTFSVLAIDDGSTEAVAIDCLATPRHVRDVEIVRLACNLGHQRAIAVGLVEVCGREGFDAVVVMDCDGEDRPADIPRLLAAAAKNPGCVVCAQRRSRPDHLIFRIWYECYKIIFRLLTGASIDFGNFCLIPADRLEALVTSASIWNHLAAALTRSRIPLASLPTDRGSRYAGASKMNFVSLVMHGLSAVAVYSDVVMVRLMLLTSALSVVALLGVLIVVAIKLFSNLGIPGWASSAGGLLIVILLQCVALFAISAFSVLNMRSMKVFVPRVDAAPFVRFRRQVQAAPRAQAAE